MPIDTLSVLCAKLTRDLLAIAKFLLHLRVESFGTLRALVTWPDLKRLTSASLMSVNPKIVMMFYLTQHGV